MVRKKTVDKIHIYELSTSVTTNKTVLNAAFKGYRVKSWKIVPPFKNENPYVIVETY